MTIIVGVNDTPSALAALRWATAEGRLRGTEVVATMAAGSPLSSYPLGWPTSPVDGDALLEACRASLDAIIDRALPHGPRPVPRVATGAAAEVLLEQAERGAPELLVVGTRGLHGVFRWLGSVSDEVARLAPGPVAVIPEPSIAAPSGAPVLVGVDGSPNSFAAIEWALEEARFRQVPLRAVCIWTLFEQRHADGVPHPFDPHYDSASAERFLAETVEKAVGPTAAADIELVTSCDLPAPGLVRAADEAEAPVLVVGARGVGGFKGLLMGSVCRKVLVTTTRPVVVVHHVEP